MSLETLLAQALDLPEAERGALAARLLLSLEADDPASPSAAEWDASWADEVDRRVAEIRAGKVDLVDGDVVLAEARALLDARRS